MRQLLIDVDPFDLSPPYPFDLSPPSMVGRRISDEVRQMALSMSLQGIPDSEVHEYTGISVRSIKRLRSAHRRAGEVLCKSLVHGRPRSLTSMQSQFLCDCVKRTPDMALAELKTELQEVCGVDVSISTIARTLQRQGFTMKTVCFFFPAWFAHSLTTIIALAACFGAKRGGSRGIQEERARSLPPRTASFRR
jgi:transposase